MMADARGENDYGAKRLWQFATMVQPKDIMLLYDAGTVHVGRVKKDGHYFYVKPASPDRYLEQEKFGDDYAPYRIGVDWKFVSTARKSLTGHTSNFLTNQLLRRFFLGDSWQWNVCYLC